MSKQFYITTAIDYVNGQPHLGHAYEKIIADVIARGHRMLGEEVFYLTGIDEHGQKVQGAAAAEGKDAQSYCDELASSWRKFANVLGLSNNDFVRTTDTRHKRVVQGLLAKLHADGHFYKSKYEGFYSKRQETFLTEKDQNDDGTWPEIYGEVEPLVEENYYFKMGAHQQWLIDHIEAHEDFVRPESRRNEVLGFLKNNKLEDLCISRPKERLTWGIPFPFDEEFVTWVWFDALPNYISIPASRGDASVRDALSLTDLKSDESADLWPADVHVIGKDILKFHAVYWPIMLKAAGLPLPKQVLVHGWWQKDDAKISKSTGNTVNPVTIIDDWGLDAFRYYVIRELDIGPDGNWTDEGFAKRYESELVKGVGNFINRSLTMLGKYREGVVPGQSDELAKDVAVLVNEFEASLRANRLQNALVGIWKIISLGDKYIDQTKPFKLAKDPVNAERLDAILYNLSELCRIVSVLLTPFLPQTSARIRAQLGWDGDKGTLEDARWGILKAGHKIGEVAGLFPRREPKI